MHRRVLASLLVLIVFAAFGVAAKEETEGASMLRGETDLNAVGKDFYVYRDFNSSSNNFTFKVKISSDQSEALTFDLDENDRRNIWAGTSSICCRVDTLHESWGGWLFTDGYVPQGANAPILNSGQYPNAGYDLSGAETLTFMARGENGRERIEFFMGGLGWNTETGYKVEPYADSAPRISTGVVTLTKEYQQYAIDLTGQDLSYISCGFGFTVSGRDNNDGAIFYLDDIKYTFSEERETPFFLFKSPYLIIVLLGAALASGTAWALFVRAKKRRTKRY